MRRIIKRTVTTVTTVTTTITWSENADATLQQPSEETTMTQEESEGSEDKASQDDDYALE